MDLDAFVTEHGPEWNRLQALLGKPRRKLSAADVDEMVVLYRRTATHLSVVRSRSPDPALVAWLSRLVLRARASITPSSGFSGAALARFFTVSFPVAVYRSARWWGGVAAVFLGLVAVLIALVASDERRALSFMSAEEINQLVENDFAAYYSTYAPQNFAFEVWTNNAWVSAICLAAGVIIVPTLVVLAANALNTGVVGGVMVGHGHADVFFGLLTIHGLLELTCVFVAAGVGLRIGWAWIAPGPLLTRTQSVARMARTGMVVAVGLVPVLLVSGLVEAFITPSPLIVPVKLTIGALVWLGFLAYVIGFGARAARLGETGDVAAHEREVLAPAV